MPVFVQGYLIVMAKVDTKTRDIIAKHLEELMSDCNMCGWEEVRAYHGILLNQMEQGHLSWQDCEQKLKICQALVCYSAPAPTAPSSP